MAEATGRGGSKRKMETTRRHRILMLVLAVVVLAGALSARLYQLQVQRSEGLRARAISQHERRVEVPPTRGAIVDRHGRELAVSLATESLFAHPWRVEQPKKAARLLAPILGLSKGKILELLRSDKPFVYLRRFLEPEQAEAVRQLDLPVGDNQPFGFLPSSKRYYTRDDLAVHVVGFANIDGVGVEGIEKQFDAELRGDPSVYLVLQDGRNGRLRELVGPPEKRPQEVVLTLDLLLQHVTERELDRAMRETGARSASAVLMDPTNGQILALANRPAADLNRYDKAGAAARINRAVVHQYEPGSTFKIVPMAAALELGTIRPDQRFDCERGSYRLGRRTIGDTSPNGLLSAREIMQKSSNIGMVKIARTLEPKTLRNAILRFGFGDRTGIELPGEQAGLLRPVSQWNAYSRASLAFGQEVGSTVLQMAAAFAIVANDGVRIPPRIVIGIRDHDGRLHRFAPPKARRVVSHRTARELTSMLEGVISSGTGRRAEVPGYRLAGKSGTAQKIVDGRYSETEYVASFGGFGPVRSPRIVGLVVLDSPRSDRHQGGQVAAPVFRRIMSDALRYLRVPGDRERLAVSREPARSNVVSSGPIVQPDPLPTKSMGKVPELIGLSLREAVTRLAARGLRSEVEGSGVVVAQHPAPGQRLAPDGVCRLRLTEPVRSAAARGSRREAQPAARSASWSRRP